MITCYFGVPGSGKSTLLTKFAINELKKINQGRSKYKRVYTNFDCVGCFKISFQDLDTYRFDDCLILLDELMLDADNRGFKTFPIGIRDFLTLHRHLGVDIIYATQAYDKVDVKIRALTQNLWYMSKSVVPLISEFTFCKRIYRCVTITEFNGELVMGYRFANFIEMIFAKNIKIIFRRPLYKYFDSFDEGCLAQRVTMDLILWNDEFKATKFDDVLKYLNETSRTVVKEIITRAQFYKNRRAEKNEDC